MIGKFVKGKVYVFIDAENLFYAQRTLGWRISYEKLMRYMKRECGADTKCFVYKGVDEQSSAQRKFLDMLDINGYIVRTKVVKKIRSHDGGMKWKNNLDNEPSLLISGSSKAIFPNKKESGATREGTPECHHNIHCNQHSIYVNSPIHIL